MSDQPEADIIITISGKCASGKSGISLEIAQLLEAAGIPVLLTESTVIEGDLIKSPEDQRARMAAIAGRKPVVYLENRHLNRSGQHRERW